MKTTKKYIKITIVILSFLMTNKGKASPQFPDLLIYQGDTIGVYNLLLEQYFEQFTKNDNIEGKLFGLNFREGASFNCWRGYQAIYKIENHNLWLEHITSCNEYIDADRIDIIKSKRRINDIFGEKVQNGKVLIDWFSGDFSFPKPNRRILRWDGVFYRSFEEEILIEIKAGKVQKITEVENYIDKPNSINRRYRDTLSTIIFKEIEKIKWSNIDKFDCSETYMIKIGKNGKIRDVIMRDYQTKKQIKEFWDTKREYNYCLTNLRRGLSDLKFDILKRGGKSITENIYIEIWFNNDGTIENWTY